jgi:hypothetical protein
VFGLCVQSKACLVHTYSHTRKPLCADPITTDGQRVRIYFKVVSAAGSLPKHRCVRDTNAVETYHTHFHALLAGSDNSPAHAQAMFDSFNGRCVPMN